MPPGWDRGAEPLLMFAVSTSEANAEDCEEPLQLLPLATVFPTEGESDAVNAATVLDSHRTRWTIDKTLLICFHKLNSGTLRLDSKHSRVPFRP